jgi:hypothetical protein
VFPISKKADARGGEKKKIEVGERLEEDGEKALFVGFWWRRMVSLKVKLGKDAGRVLEKLMKFSEIQIRKSKFPIIQLFKNSLKT